MYLATSYCDIHSVANVSIRFGQYGFLETAANSLLAHLTTRSLFMISKHGSPFFGYETTRTMLMPFALVMCRPLIFSTPVPMTQHCEFGTGGQWETVEKPELLLVTQKALLTSTVKEMADTSYPMQKTSP